MENKSKLDEEELKKISGGLGYEQDGEWIITDDNELKKNEINNISPVKK